MSPAAAELRRDGPGRHRLQQKKAGGKLATPRRRARAAVTGSGARKGAQQMPLYTILSKIVEIQACRHTASKLERLEELRREIEHEVRAHDAWWVKQAAAAEAAECSAEYPVAF